MASLGDSLREEREARNISIEEIASATKIGSRYLEALETDRLDLMPGGFFVKAIIRSYARAVGLDPEKVLERYRAAGMLEPPEATKSIFPKRPAPAPIPPEVAPAAAPPVPQEAPAPAPAAPAGEEKPAPGVLFEEASSKPERLSLSRQRLPAWAWRGLAAVVIVGAALILWAPWRRHPAPAGQPSASVQTRIPTMNPADRPAETPAPPTEAAKAAEKAPTETGQQAAPAAGETSPGITIEIVFEAETWIQVYTDGTLRIAGTFPAGASVRAQASEQLLIHTGNAGGFTFKLNGRPAKPLGGPGQILSDIKITLQNLKDFLEAPSSGGPGG